MSAIPLAAWWIEQEKNDEVSLDMTQVVSVLTIAMVITGLSIQMDRFHSIVGAYACDKNICAGRTLAENGRGAYVRGGGRREGDSMVVRMHVLYVYTTQNTEIETLLTPLEIH